MVDWQIRWARSATKHRISKERIAFVIRHCGLVFSEAPPEGRIDDRVLFLGDDAHGVALEVMALHVSLGELVVIHAMHLRPKYRRYYEEAWKWRQ